ncbi:MAG: DUF6783 domain-containing protein [Ruminococcus sp.]
MEILRPRREGAVSGYGNRIRANIPQEWGVQRLRECFFKQALATLSYNKGCVNQLRSLYSPHESEIFLLPVP